jgi:hypothetical protein
MRSRCRLCSPRRDVVVQELETLKSRCLWPRLFKAETAVIAECVDLVLNLMQITYMANDAAITVRVPMRLKKRLAQRAMRERRSISAQVVHELERAVSDDDDGGHSQPALALFEGARLPTDQDLVDVRVALWGRLVRQS